MNENGQKLQEHINEELQTNIKQLYKHADVANAEMAAIKNDIGWIKNIIEKWESRLEKLDTRLWWILGTIILGFIIQVVLKFSFK